MILSFFRDFSSDVRSNMFKDDDGNWTCQFCGYNSKERFHLVPKGPDSFYHIEGNGEVGSNIFRL